MTPVRRSERVPLSDDEGECFPKVGFSKMKGRKKNIHVVAFEDLPSISQLQASNSLVKM